DDEFAENGQNPMRYPSHDRTIRLLKQEKEAAWFDNTKTPSREDMRTVVTRSFQKSIDSLTGTRGPFGENWQWGKVKGTRVPHILGQDALGSGALFMGGGKGTINALNDHNGPSWRMVVELGDTIKAYGIYPGGQSGNPGSPYYDNMIETWRQGKLNRLVFLGSPDEADPAIVSKTVLQ
ncbi:MAG TPA: penicillin acylase family protein, partial [Anseongella sp.]|nr:penicillin acylase family protein [Anseongella sp.]